MTLPFNGEPTEYGFTHEPKNQDETLCGIKAEDFPSLPIACDCGHPECEHPLTCPACKAILMGKVN